MERKIITTKHILECCPIFVFGPNTVDVKVCFYISYLMNFYEPNVSENSVSRTDKFEN